MMFWSLVLGFRVQGLRGVDNMGSSVSGDFAGLRLRTRLNLGFWLISRKSRVGTWEVGSGVGGSEG